MVAAVVELPCAMVLSSASPSGATFSTDSCDSQTAGQLRRGSVVPLDKLAGDPVDVFVNGRMVARGEVLVLNDNFCVRIAELISGDEGD